MNQQKQFMDDGTDGLGGMVNIISPGCYFGDVSVLLDERVLDKRIKKKNFFLQACACMHACVCVFIHAWMCVPMSTKLNNLQKGSVKDISICILICRRVR